MITWWNGENAESQFEFNHKPGAYRRERKPRQLREGCEVKEGKGDIRIHTFIIIGVDIMLIYFHICFGFPLPIYTPALNRPLLTSLTCTPTYVGYLFTLLGYKASLFPILHQTAFSLSQYLLWNMYGEQIPSFLSCLSHRFSSALLQIGSVQLPFPVVF